LKKVFYAIDKIIERIEILGSTISLIIITILVFLQVALRYLFGSSLPWTEEVIITSIIYMALIGAARAVRLKGHTEVSGAANALPKYAGISLRVFTNIIVFAVLILMVYGSLVLTGRTNNVSMILRYPLKVNYYGIAIGATLMFYEYIKLFKSRILGR